MCKKNSSAIIQNSTIKFALIQSRGIHDSPSYILKSDDEFLSFEFSSEGPRGTIIKLIEFRRLHVPNFEKAIYNLALGDFNNSTRKVDDKVLSNNLDSDKIIFTVINAITLFFDNHPNTFVFIIGNTNAKKRFYCMSILKIQKEIVNFEIWGALNEQIWEPFRANQRYQALLVKRN
jgi:hypothetical protein